MIHPYYGKHSIPGGEIQQNLLSDTRENRAGGKNYEKLLLNCTYKNHILLPRLEITSIPYKQKR